MTVESYPRDMNVLRPQSSSASERLQGGNTKEDSHCLLRLPLNSPPALLLLPRKDFREIELVARRRRNQSNRRRRVIKEGVWEREGPRPVNGHSPTSHLGRPLPPSYLPAAAVKDEK